MDNWETFVYFRKGDKILTYKSAGFLDHSYVKEQLISEKIIDNSTTIMLEYRKLD